MLRSVLLVALLVGLLAPTALAAETVELEATTGKDEYVLVGDGANIKVYVENKNNMTGVSGISVTISGPESLSFTPSSKTISIGADSIESFTVKVSGELDGSATVTIKVAGKETDDYDTNGDTTTVKVREPKFEMEVITPIREITWVVDNAKIPQETNFDVSVRNIGEDTISGLKLSLAFDETKVSCSVSGATRTVAVGNLVKYPVTCRNVTTGDRVTLKFDDSNGEIKELDSIELKLTESFKVKELDIQSPLENQEFIIGEHGEDIDVTVKNTGEVAFREVCVRVDNMEHAASGCADLRVGAEHTYTLNIVPIKDITNARIVVSDKDGLATDQVTIRVLKRESILIPIDDPIDDVVNDTPVVVPINDSVEEPGDTIIGIPSWIVFALIISIPIVILIYYVKTSIARAE